ncbi:mechanosensitive ion channel family protein [Rhizobium ruizarguesonis]|uniref:mechanosensitive ion channel family protein n=1 Tax=Rhizobium ruizarguesonis TaxID=2081791 RepID=UPI00371BD2AD
MSLDLRQGKRAISSATVIFLLQIIFALASPLGAQGQAAEPPGEFQQLDDLEVRQWLVAKQATPSPVASTTPSGVASQLVAQIRNHLDGASEAATRIVPEWLAARERVAGEVDDGTPILRAFGFALFIGYGSELLLRYLLRRSASRSAATFGPGLAALVRIAPLIVFAIAALVAFVLADWPSSLEAAVAPSLIAWIAARLLIAVTSAMIEPAYEAAEEAKAPQRGVLLAPHTVRFWHRRVVLFVCTVAFLWAVMDTMQALSFPVDVRDLTATGLGLVVLAISIDTVLRRPVTEGMAGRRFLRSALLLAFLIMLWFVWVVDMKVVFWLGIYALGLPPLLRFVTATTRTMLDAEATDNISVMRNVLIDRGARFIIIALAAAWLAIVFRFNGSIIMQDAVFNRVFRGVLAGVVILLAADLIWQLTKEFINLSMKPAGVDVADPILLARSMRLRTLLPILRNFLGAVIAVVAGMMVLSGLGVEVAPLIAGAGVFGVAIGFGSQTLVKDVISGIFYMMDDAFRIGEYIKSGSYMGTVESFSIRSVKLRHHCGPVFTVPFGSLGAVENMSRDWVIDEFLINVSYGSDVGKVKKVVKGVGAKLLEDEELGPLILETVKMKGIEEFGDYGITLSFALTTKPGHQTKVRRRAQALIKDTFDAQAILFASPTRDETKAATGAAATRDANAGENTPSAEQQEEAAAE